MIVFRRDKCQVFQKESGRFMSSRSVDVAVASRSNLNRIGILDWDVTMGCWMMFTFRWLFVL